MILITQILLLQVYFNPAAIRKSDEDCTNDYLANKKLERDFFHFLVHFIFMLTSYSKNYNALRITVEAAECISFIYMFQYFVQ